MPSRIEIELTSQRDETTWTWRAAGARQPKGVVDTSILPQGVSVGDVFKAEADFDMDGITVLSVQAPGRVRSEPERLVLISSEADEPLVTTRLASKERTGRTDRPRRSDRGPRGDRGERGERGDKGERAPRGERTGRGPRRDDKDGRGEREPRRRSGPPRPEVPPPPTRPKPPRLRAGRKNRQAILAELPAEQRPIAEQVLKGGLPGVRQALDKQNEEAKAAGLPEVKPDALLQLAESMLPRLRTAEWRDRAEAALEQLKEVDLRDLRSVVTAADRAARDDEGRELAAQLRTGLKERLDQEHAEWVSDLTEAVENGRTIRGLRLSSRPPKAGSPVPPELAEKLVAMANASLSAEISTDRWIRVLDALAFSPIRRLVVPASLPPKPSDELVAAISRMGSRLPELAHVFGIKPETPAERRTRRKATTGAAAPAKKKPRKKKPVADVKPGPEAAVAPETEPEPVLAPEVGAGDPGLGAGTDAEPEPDAAAAPVSDPEPVLAPEVGADDRGLGAGTEAEPEPEVPAEAEPVPVVDGESVDQ